MNGPSAAKIRPYRPTDKEELISIIKLHTPKYFDSSEESDFREYLENEIDQYFVIEKTAL